jgi:phosphatidylserine/phosphatidylglycerophosphate/cardiolipin synthase-like enzyme
MLDAHSVNTPAPGTTVLVGSWQSDLESLLASASIRITLCAPYITESGARIVRSACTERGVQGPSALLLTDLSPMAICTGATEPEAIAGLRAIFPDFRSVHLPRLHAKVYAADRRQAIVTSGNLTHGGIWNNYELGLFIKDPAVAARVDDGICAYSGLGADIDETTLARMCDLAVDARLAYRAQTASASRASARRLRTVLESTSDTLVRARLAGGPIHTVFSRTIEYLLRIHGPMSTVAINHKIQQMHPDLCDDTVDRVIDGKRYGKKWKHAVRTSQQQLKRRGIVALTNGVWILVD